MQNSTTSPPFIRRSSSSAQKEPVLHDSLLLQSIHQQIPSSISSTSSSSTSLSVVINGKNGNNLQNSSYIADGLEKLHLRNNHQHNCIASAPACPNNDLENDAVLFNTLNNTEGLSSVRSHMDLAKTANSVRTLAKRLNRATISLNVKSVIIITKARDNSLIYLTKEMVEWLLVNFSSMNVYVDKKLETSHRFDYQGLLNDVPTATVRLKFWDKQLILANSVPFDFVITLGGDGTVLHASTMFQNVVPPIISFSLGSLGFLTNFEFENFREVLSKAATKGVKTDLRMRFTCKVHAADGSIICEQQVLNELTIDRGPSPYVTMLELYGDEHLLTVAQADGLIIATPTGSTAYSLSAGGSLVHPEVSCICITPICPHTLSFRPIMVPDSIKLTVKVPSRSRSTAWAAFDGRNRVKLEVGGYVTICASRFPFPTVKNENNLYFENVSRVLNWNVRKEQKGFKHLLSDKNKKICDAEENASIAAGSDTIQTDDEELWDIDYSDLDEN